MKSISVTQRSSFKACRRQFNWAYNEKLEPKGGSIGALWFGRLIHFCLAGYYRGKKWEDEWDRWLVLQADEFGTDHLEDERTREFLRLGRDMMERYVPWAQQADRGWEVLEVEPEWKVKVPGRRVLLDAHPDLVIRWNGRLWVVDHKTKSSFSSPAELEFDDQMIAYLWATYQRYGEMPKGAIYSQLRKKSPAAPMLLKSGKALSRDKQIDTTYDLYYQAILENKFNPNDYLEILDHIRKIEFFKREPIEHARQTIENFGRQLYEEFGDMTRKDVPLYPNKTHECTWRCSYHDLCKATDEGGDVESLKEMNYVKNTTGRRA